MLDFLDDYFNEEELKEIKNNIRGPLAFDLNSNQDNVIEIVKYLKSLKLNVSNLLITDTDIFFKEIDEIKELFIEELNQQALLVFL